MKQSNIIIFKIKIKIPLHDDDDDDDDDDDNDDDDDENEADDLRMKTILRIVQLPYLLIVAHPQFHIPPGKNNLHIALCYYSLCRNSPQIFFCFTIQK